MFSESETKADKENIILNIFDDRKKKKNGIFHRYLRETLTYSNCFEKSDIKNMKSGI